MNTKKENTVLTRQFLDDWSDRCDIPYCKMQEIYDAMKETLKEYIDQRKGVQLSNFLQIVPIERSKQVSYHDLKTGQRVTKERSLPFSFRAKLSDYLKYPYPYSDYPERKLKNAEKE